MILLYFILLYKPTNSNQLKPIMPLTQAMFGAIVERNLEIISESMERAFDLKEMFGDGAYLIICKRIQDKFEMMNMMKENVCAVQVVGEIAEFILQKISNSIREMNRHLQEHPVALKISFNHFVSKDKHETMGDIEYEKIILDDVKYYKEGESNKVFCMKGEYVGVMEEETGEIIC